MPTTISVPEEVADELYERKARGESYADVIRRLLDQDEGGQRPTGSDETDAGVVPDETPAPTPDATRSAEEAESAADRFDEIVDVVAEATLPGSGAKYDERRAAFDAVVEYLREHGEATPAEFQQEVYPEHPARYEDGKDPARSWWKNAMYPALAELSDRTDAVESADETGEWRWRGKP